jgi:spermidine/putrescine transport system ATP-binding protein
MSDRIAVIYQGKLQQIGTPIEIYEYPQNRFIADFIGETNFLTGRVIENLAGQVMVLVDEQLQVLVTQPEHLPISQVVTLVIRPEKANIYPSNSEVENAWLGTVEEVVYIGTDTRYSVRLSEQSSIVIRRQNLHRDDLQRYGVGERVLVVVSPESICILASDLVC